MIDSGYSLDQRESKRRIIDDEKHRVSFFGTSSVSCAFPSRSWIHSTRRFSWAFVNESWTWTKNVALGAGVSAGQPGMCDHNWRIIAGISILLRVLQHDPVSSERASCSRYPFISLTWVQDEIHLTQSLFLFWWYFCCLSCHWRRQFTSRNISGQRNQSGFGSWRCPKCLFCLQERKYYHVVALSWRIWSTDNVLPAYYRRETSVPCDQGPTDSLDWVWIGDNFASFDKSQESILLNKGWLFT